MLMLLPMLLMLLPAANLELLASGALNQHWEKIHIDLTRSTRDFSKRSTIAADLFPDNQITLSFNAFNKKFCVYLTRNDRLLSDKLKRKKKIFTSSVVYRGFAQTTAAATYGGGGGGDCATFDRVTQPSSSNTQQQPHHNRRNWARFVRVESENSQHYYYMGTFFIDGDGYEVDFKFNHDGNYTINDETSGQVIARGADLSSSVDGGANHAEGCKLKRPDFALNSSSFRHFSTSGNGSAGMLKRDGLPSGCSQTGLVLELPVGVALDCSYISKAGSLDGAVQRAIMSFNSVAELYEIEFNIDLKVSDIVAFPNCTGPAFNRMPDAYYPMENRLDDFSKWRASKANVDDSPLWHLLTDGAIDGTLGIAWFDSFCFTSSVSMEGGTYSGTGVSNFDSREWTTIAHEIGHNLGAEHDCIEQYCVSQLCRDAKCYQCIPCVDECDCKEKYLMNPYSVSLPEYRFSPRTRDSVCYNLGRASSCLKPVVDSDDDSGKVSQSELTSGEAGIQVNTLPSNVTLCNAITSSSDKIIFGCTILDKDNNSTAAIVILSESGDLVSIEKLSGNGVESADVRCVQTTSDGRLIYAGSYKTFANHEDPDIYIKMEGVPLTNVQSGYLIRGCFVTDVDHIVLAGQLYLRNIKSSYIDYFRILASGIKDEHVTLFSESYSLNDLANDVKVAPSSSSAGSLFTVSVGQKNGMATIWFVKNFRVQKSISLTDYIGSEFTSLAVDWDSGVAYAAGYTDDFGSKKLGKQALVARFQINSYKRIGEDLNFGGVYNDRINSIVIASDKSVWIGGYLNGIEDDSAAFYAKLDIYALHMGLYYWKELKHDKDDQVMAMTATDTGSLDMIVSLNGKQVHVRVLNVSKYSNEMIILGFGVSLGILALIAITFLVYKRLKVRNQVKKKPHTQSVLEIKKSESTI